MDEITVTAAEKALMHDLVQHNEYGERGCLDNQPWSWAVCGTRSKAGVMGSLVKKGLANTTGTGNDASCHLTTAGKRKYIELFGAEGTWTNETL